MIRRPRLTPANRWLEPLFAAVIVGALAYVIWHLVEYGYLPQPYFYEPFDMWGDWFNVSYWAHDPGTYDAYRSIYPPLSFVFLRIFSISSCYQVVGSAEDYSVGLAARDCDWLGVAMVQFLYIANFVVVALTFRKHDRKTALWRTIALAAGFPISQAFEHANLIIPTLTLVILAFGPLLSSTKLRWLALGLAVNFKIYVIAALIPQLLRRRWLWVEGALISVISIYLVTYGILGAGSPMEIYNNVRLFAASGASNLLDVWFPATFLAFQALLENWQSPLMMLLGSHWVEVLKIVLPTLQHTTQALIVIASVMAWIRPEAITRYRLSNLGISLALITTESGGYSVILTFFFTLLEPWKGIGRKWAIIAVYILCIPLDIPIGYVPEVIRDTYIPGRTVIADYKIMIGPFIRPLFFYSIPFALALVTIREVWVDIRQQGWKNRWRYRHDAPILPNVTRPHREPETAA